MADNILCIDCGHNETSHGTLSINNIKPGYRCSLNDCRGWRPDPKDIKRQEELVEKWTERGGSYPEPFA